MVKLRKYQEKAVEAVFRQLRDQRAALLVQATGTGKTIVFCSIAKRIVDSGGRVLILAHRDELIRQAADKILVTQGITPGIEKAEKHADGEPVVVASVATLAGRKRLEAYQRDAFDLIIIDEAHHAAADRYRKIFDYFNAEKTRFLGVTATPFRKNSLKEVLELFGGITYEYTMTEAIRDGYLAEIHIKTIPLEIDISQVRESHGDFADTELGAALEPYLEEIAEVMLKECRGRKTLVFLPLIATAEKFTEILKSHDFRAVEIDGKTKDREEILNSFETGEIEVLCNSMLLTEGWDCPPVDCIINLRATRSKTLYTQILGRGTRTAPGKKNLLVLDFLWQSKEYDVCGPAILTAENEEIAAELEGILNSGREVDLTEATEVAKERTIAAREAKLAKELREATEKYNREEERRKREEERKRQEEERKRQEEERKRQEEERKQRQKRNRQKKLISPRVFAREIGEENITGYRPMRPWEELAPTDRQIEVLRQNGIDTDEISSKGYASVIIDRIFTRQELGLATPKQINYLNRRGYQRVGYWTKNEASEVISAISQNNWKIPLRYSPDDYLPERIRN